MTQKPLSQPKFPQVDMGVHSNPVRTKRTVAYEVRGEMARIADKFEAKENGVPVDLEISDAFDCIEIRASREGFEHLAKVLLKMAEAEPGTEEWFPVGPGPMVMGEPFLVLRKAR